MPKPEIRINDECPNDEFGHSSLFSRHSSFGFDSDFWFRHSDFAAIDTPLEVRIKERTSTCAV